MLFDDDPPAGMLQYLTFAPGAFGADELAELLGTSVRSIRKVLAAVRLSSVQHSVRPGRG